MRIRLPSEIPLPKAFLFCCTLFIVELAEGTDPIYAMLVFCFFMISVLAFNTAEGFTRPSGAYIFFYSTLVAGVATVYKALLGQAAQTHLYTPVLMMSVYVATVGAMLLAAFVRRQFVNMPDGMAGVMHVPKVNFETSALGCLVIYFLIVNSTRIFPGGNGTILHALAMLNYFLPLGMLLGTIGAVRRTNGQRSTSAITWTALIYATYYGLLSFSKQGMFSPFVCWVLGMAWAGFRLRRVHLCTIIGFCIVAQMFMVPLANVGRVDSVTGTDEERLAITEHYLEHPFLLYKTNKERVGGYSTMDTWYFGTPQGIFDRFTMMPNDSQLIAFTEQGHYFGYLPVIVYFENWVPHMINPHKLEGVRAGGNAYAHEMGELADEDVSTGISYSPSAEAFHMDGWRSVLLVQPVIFLLLFLTTDAICGDLRRQPWGLLPMLIFAHIAPEGLLQGPINYVWIGNLGTVVAIFASGYITPIFGQLLKGRERDPGWRFNLPHAVSSPASEPA